MEVTSFIVLNRTTWRIIHEYLNITWISPKSVRMSESKETSLQECESSKDEIDLHRDHEIDSEVETDKNWQNDNVNEDEIFTKATESAVKNPNKYTEKLLKSSPEIEQRDQTISEDFDRNIVSFSVGSYKSNIDHGRHLINFNDTVFDPNITALEIYEEMKKVVKLERTLAQRDQEITFLRNQLKEENQAVKSLKKLESTLEKKDQEIISLKCQLKEQKAENQKLKVVNVETTNALRVQKSEFVQKNRVLSPKATSEIRPDHPSLLDLQSETVFIHKDLAGAIIGPFGSRIRAIRGSSNATIVIGEEIIGNNKRTITITGTPQQIKIAKDLLDKSARENTVC